MSTSISDVTAELVRCGLPRLSHGPTIETSGWIAHERPANGCPEAPAQIIELHLLGEEQDQAFLIYSCSCCTQVARVQMLDEDGEGLAMLRFWPGLGMASELYKLIAGTAAVMEQEAAADG